MKTAQLSTEHEIQSAYSGSSLADGYVAQRFDSELNRLLHASQVQSINALMRRFEPARTLEIAPGPGRVTRNIRPCGELVCLEFNEGMIAEGKRHCSFVTEWIRGNAFELSFENEFDLVYSFRFIRHFKRPDRLRLYEQIRQALMPGGWVVFDAVNERQSRPLREANPDSFPVYDKLYRRRELFSELQFAGFAQIALTPVQKFYRLQYLSQVTVGPRSEILNRLIIQGLESLPRRSGLEWIVTCRRA